MDQETRLLRGIVHPQSMTSNISNFQQFKSSRNVGISIPKQGKSFLDQRFLTFQPRKLSFLRQTNSINTNINGLPVIPCILNHQSSKVNASQSLITEESTCKQPQSNEQGNETFFGDTGSSFDRPLMIEVSDEIDSGLGSVSEFTRAEPILPAINKPTNKVHRLSTINSFLSEAAALKKDLDQSNPSIAESLSTDSVSEDTKMDAPENVLEKIIRGGRRNEVDRRNAVVPMLLSNVWGPIPGGAKGEKSLKLRRILDYSSLIWHFQGYRHERGDTHNMSPQERWWFAINSLNKLLATFDHQPSLFEKDIFTDQGPTADFVFKLYKYVNNIVLSSKIQFYYRKENSEVDRMRLIHYFSKRLQFFSKLSYQQMLRILKFGTYMRVSKGTKIVKQGNKAEDVYFILSGQITVFKTVYDTDSVSEVPTTTFTAGDSITQAEGSPSYQKLYVRDSSMVATAQSELFRLHRGTPS
jgi:hypothetical protein